MPETTDAARLPLRFVRSPDGRRQRFDQLLQIAAKRVFSGITQFEPPVNTADVLFQNHHLNLFEIGANVVFSDEAGISKGLWEREWVHLLVN